MTYLSYKLKDKELLKLIAKYLRVGIMSGKHFVESREDVPQGGPLSPLLANIMLDPLDKELEKRGHKFARYADDFTILVSLFDQDEFKFIRKHGIDLKNKYVV
jgi:RNA-directed DNA polymerase